MKLNIKHLYAYYLILISAWELGYVSYNFGKDGVVPFSFLLIWLFVVGSIAVKTNYYKLYWVLFTGISLLGSGILIGVPAVLVTVEFLVAVFFGTFVTNMLGGFDYDEAAE